MADEQVAQLYATLEVIAETKSVEEMESALESLDSQLGSVVKGIEEARKAQEEYEEWTKAVTVALDALGITAEDWATQLQRNEAAMLAAHDEALQMNAAIDKQAVEVSKTGDAWEKFGAVLNAVQRGSFKDLLNAFMELPAWLGAAFTAFNMVTGAIKGAWDAVAKFSDEAEKLSNKSLITGIDVETLQRYGRAAEVAGQSSEQLTSAMRRLSTQIEGNGKAFKRLGIDLTSFKAKESGEQIKILADKIMSYGTAAERAAAAQLIFGRSGMQMLPTLEAIHKGVGDTAVVIGGAAIDAMAKFNDKTDLLSGALKDLNQNAIAVVSLSIAQNFGPAIEGITAAIKLAIPIVVEFLSVVMNVFDNIVNIVKARAEGAVQIVTAMVTSWTLGMETIEKLAKGQISIGDAFKTIALTAEIAGKAIVEGMERAQTPTLTYTDYAEKLRMKLAETSDGTDKFGKAGEGAAEKWDKAMKRIMDRAKQAQRDINEMFEAAQRDRVFEKDAGMSGSMAGSINPRADTSEEGIRSKLLDDQKQADALRKQMREDELAAMMKAAQEQERIRKDAERAALAIQKEALAAQKFAMVLSGIAEFGAMLGGDTGSVISGMAGHLGNYADQMRDVGKMANGAEKEQAKFNAKVSLGAAAAGLLGGVLSKSTNPSVAKLGGALQGAAAGAKMGMAFGPWGAAVGAAAGAIFGFINKAKQMKKEMDEMKKKFIESNGGLEKLTQTAKDAGINIDKAFKAKSPAEMKKAIEDATKQLEAYNKLIEKHGGSLDGLKAAAAKAGVDLKRLWDAKDPAAYLKAVEDISKELDTFQQALDKGNEIMERYGLTLEQMGPRFASLKLNEMASTLVEDWTYLVGIGADLNAVLEKMAPEVAKFLDTSIRAGVEVPSAMKPIIDKLWETGQLIHENGEAYTQAEYDAIKYGKTQSEMMDSLIAKITELVNALLGIPTNVTTTVTTRHEDTYAGGGGGGGRREDPGGDVPFADGGIVTRPTRALIGEAGAEAVIPLNKAGNLGGGASKADLDAMIGKQTRELAKVFRDAVLQARG